jgi:hypothetical protein
MELIFEVLVGLTVGGVVLCVMIGLWELTGPLDRPADELWEDKEDK